MKIIYTFAFNIPLQFFHSLNKITLWTVAIKVIFKSQNIKTILTWLQSTVLSPWLWQPCHQVWRALLGSLDERLPGSPPESLSSQWCCQSHPSCSWNMFIWQNKNLLNLPLSIRYFNKFVSDFCQLIVQFPWSQESDCVGDVLVFDMIHYLMYLMISSIFWLSSRSSCSSSSSTASLAAIWSAILQHSG